MTRTTEPLAHFEERLLSELKQEVMGRQPGVRQAKSRSPRPRRIMVAAAIGVSAAVAAGLAVATATAPAGTPAVRYSLAADFLNRAAAAARAQNAPLPRPDQVSYIEQLVVSPGPHGGIRECRVQWSLSPLTGLPGGVGGGRCGPGVPAVPSAALKAMRSASKPTYYLYPALNTLPTSPAALRAALYAAAARGGAAWGLPTVHSADAIVASLIETLMGVPMSGPLRASLYELLAQTPGVTLVPNAVDAAGRHGTGIVTNWDYPGYGQGTTETIFAPGTYTVLGGNNIMPGQRVYFAIMGSGLVTLPGS
jgi:hypothetical protein